MATLENYLNNETIFLLSHHIFGRRETGSNTLLKSKDVSRVHASICWEDSVWQILDHSRNGTWVDGARLTPQKSLALQVGNLIQFGGTQESAWRVIDLEEPCPLLVPVKGGSSPIQLKEPFYSLLSEESHEISIYLSSTQKWICESEAGEATLQNGDTIHFDQKVWQFYEVINIAPTQLETNSQTEPLPFQNNSPLLYFQVSLDEEHVFAKLTHAKEIFDLGERAHHYLLLTLARQKLKDAKEGCDIQEQGWMESEKLSTLLDLDYSYLNSQIFRARSQVAKTFLKDPSFPAKLIERRFGEIRFGHSKFKIFRGSNLEGELNLE